MDSSFVSALRSPTATRNYELAKLIASTARVADGDARILDGTSEEVVDADLKFILVGAQDPKPEAFVAAATDCINTARKNVVEARKPPSVSALIQAAFGGAKQPLHIPAKARPQLPALPSTEQSLTFPLVGMSTRPVDTNPAIAALREEKQLWRLVELLFNRYIPDQIELHIPAADLSDARRKALRSATGSERESSMAGISAPYLPFSIASSIPCDSVASERQILEALTNYDSDLSLLQVMLHWLHLSAEEDAEIKLPSGHVLTPAAADATLTVPLEGDNPSILTPERNMWQESTMLFLKAAEASLTPQLVADGAVAEALALVAAENNVLGVAHPDATLQESTTELEALQKQLEGLSNDDLQVELELVSSLWSLLRSGKPQLAQILAARFGQPWRAALLAGADLWGDEQQGDGPESEMFRRGNPRWMLFRSTAKSIAKRLISQLQTTTLHEGTQREILYYDAAILCHISGTMDGLLRNRGVIRTWEDACWETASIAAQARVHATMHAYRMDQVRSASALPWSHEELEDQPELSNVTVQHIFARLATANPTEGPDIATASASLYVTVARALFILASAYAPTVDAGRDAAEMSELPSDGIPLPQTTRSKVTDALEQLVSIMHNAVLTSSSWQDAVTANRGAQGPFVPISADNLFEKSPLDDAQLPLIRFATHLVLYLRFSSIAKSDPILSVVATDESSRLEVRRAETAARIDDIVYVYLRHLMLRSLQKPLYTESLLALLVHMSAERAVRALTSFLILLPHTPQGFPDPPRRVEVFESYVRFATDGTDALHAIFSEAIRAATRLCVRLSASTLVAFASGDTTASELELLRINNLMVPPSPPAAVMKSVNMSLLEYMRVCSLEWLILAGPAFVPELIATTNFLARTIASNVATAASRSDSFAAASPLVWLLQGWRSGSLSDTARDLLDVGVGAEFATPVVAQQLWQDAAAAVAPEALEELHCWRAVASMLLQLSAWNTVIGKALPAAPDVTNAVKQSKFGMLNLEQERRTLEHNRRLHTALIEPRLKEVAACLDALQTAAGELAVHSSSWLSAKVCNSDEDVGVKLADTVLHRPVVPTDIEFADTRIRVDIPPARLRVMLLDFLSRMFVDVQTRTREWWNQAAPPTTNVQQLATATQYITDSLKRMLQ